MQEYYTPKTYDEKKQQNKFFYWYKKENQEWIKKTLASTKRLDLLDRLLGKKEESNKPKFAKGKPSNKNTDFLKKKPRKKRTRK